MNELERLISRLPRPSPSDGLDARVAATLSAPQQHGRHFSLLRRARALACTAVCAACMGFLLGRQSISTARENETVAAGGAVTVGQRDAEISRQPTVVVRAEREALARFVTPPTPFESLFGNGPLEVRVGSFPLE